MTGGIAKNRFYVLTARPAVGKTALAVNWINAWNLAGKKVMFFSLEMSTSDLAGRMVSLLSDVNASTLLNRAHELTTQQVKQIAAAAKRLSTNNCYICDAPVITPEEMLWNCQEAYHRMGGIDVVLIDYLQLIRSKSRNDRHTRADYVADVTRSINAMCKQVAPVIALAQLSREGQKAPTMSNVKESGQIEQDANCVMILHREKVGKDEGGKDVYDHVLMVDKNRDGPTGNIPLSFELRTMAFSEIDSDGMPV
jgi:replicative DNA helicase